MSDVLTQHKCAAAHNADMVELSFGPYHVSLYYHTAFEVAAGILMAAKLAARFEGVHPTKWSEMVNTIPQDVVEPLNRAYRRTNKPSNIQTWSVEFDRNLVVLVFDNTRIRMHYSDAYMLYGWIRLAAKNAKRWAGDRSRQWTTRAHLSDAEQNDKFVYVH